MEEFLDLISTRAHMYANGMTPNPCDDALKMTYYANYIAGARAAYDLLSPRFIS